MIVVRTLALVATALLAAYQASFPWLILFASVAGLVNGAAFGYLRALLNQMTPASRLRLRRAASAYLARNPDLSRLALRFYAMLVTPWSWPRHLAGAWDDGAAPGDL